MADQLPGIYTARCISDTPERKVFIPQVFDDVPVPLYGWLDLPEVGTTGVVSFAGGDPAYPVWMGELTKP